MSITNKSYNFREDSVLLLNKVDKSKMGSVVCF